MLLASPLSVERLAIPWLHVLSEHPALLARYDRLFAGRVPRLPRRVRSILSQGLLWVRARLKRGAGEVQPQRADVLFVSHLLNEAQVGARDDFYFGGAAEHLRAEGLSPCVLLVNWTSHDARDLGRRWSHDVAPRVVLRSALGVGAELGMRRRLGREARRLRRESNAVSQPFDRAVYREAALEARTGSTIFNLRLYLQVSALIRRLRPRAVVVTYEGHAWERLVFLAARQADAAIRCIGYHHTVLFARHHAVLRPLGPGLDPDAVLTAGDLTRDRFRAAYDPGRVRVATMGTHRRMGLGEGSAAHPLAPRARTCLVIPDGIMSEVLLMFDFALACAAAIPDVRFVFRLHPIVPQSGLARHDLRFQHLPENVELSSLQLAEDFSRAGWALYRGSNAAVYGVIAGVRPLYVERDGEMSIDCMHELRAWKRVVRTPADVGALVGAAPEPAEDSREAASAAEYCNAFFMEPDYSALSEAIRG